MESLIIYEGAVVHVIGYTCDVAIRRKFRFQVDQWVLDNYYTNGVIYWLDSTALYHKKMPMISTTVLHVTLFISFIYYAGVMEWQTYQS